MSALGRIVPHDTYSEALVGHMDWKICMIGGR